MASTNDFDSFSIGSSPVRSTNWCRNVSIGIEDLSE